MQTSAVQHLLFAVMPQWYCHIAKPFKQLMRDGISLNMYYCIQILQNCGQSLTMSELARYMHIPKQQMTKLCNKLIEQQFVERLPDPDDRRIIRLSLTDRAQEYTERFLREDASYYKDIPLEQLDQAFNIALSDPYNTPRHVLISGGTPNEDESTYKWLNGIYRFFPKKYPRYDFDVMLSPRGLSPGDASDRAYEDFLLYLRDECGVKTMSVNLELFNDHLRKAAVGKDRYYRFISRAVELFGSDNIRSSIVVGLETQEDTLNGVSALLDCGCMPVLSAFVPAPGTDMVNYPAPTVEFLLDTLLKADRLATDAGLRLGPICKPCTHNSIVVETGEVDIFIDGKHYLVDIINGKGSCINRKGEKYIGFFKNGKKDGEGDLYDKEGNIIKSGVWIQDKFIS